MKPAFPSRRAAFPGSKTLRLSGMLLLLLLAGTAAAQGPLTRSAIALASAGELDEAEYKLVAAMASEEAFDPMTWYVQAFVRKEQFIAAGRPPDSPHRAEAIASIRRCREMDADGSMQRWWTPLLRFIADSYLEDVRAAIPSVAPGGPVEAEEVFDTYAEVQLMLDPDWERMDEWVLLQQQLGEAAMNEANYRERGGAADWFALGTHHYGVAAAQGPDRFRSLYNLAVHTYNQGVREFKAAEDDLDAIDDALNQAARHWRRAADLLEEAIVVDDGNPSAFEALAIVSEALLNQDRIDWCRAHIKELGGR